MLVVLGGSYFAVQNTSVQTYLISKLTNNLSKKTNTKISIKRVNYAFFKKIKLEDVLVRAQNSDTLFYSQLISAKIDSLRYKKKKISIDQLKFTNVKFDLSRDSSAQWNFNFLLDSLKSKNTKAIEWKISCKHFDFSQSNISYTDFYKTDANNYFIKDVNFNISRFNQKKDSIEFRIDELNLNDGKNLYLENLSANFKIKKKSIELSNLSLKTQKSTFENTSLFLFSKDSSFTISQLNIDFRFSGSEISFYEISQIVPALTGMDQTIYCSGRIYGDLNDLKGKDIQLRTGQNTRATIDFYANGLNDAESMFLFVDLKKSRTSFNDLSQIRLPNSSKFSYINFPSQLYNSGIITYEGNFTGFLTDFVAYGTFSSDMGILKTDVSVVPEKGFSTLFKGFVSTANFKLGELIQNKNFNEVTFNGKVNGIYNRKSHLISGNFNGDISEIEINKYVYKNIKLDGKLDHKMFDGLLKIDDPNLKFDFLGRFDFNTEIPVFNFNFDLQKALIGKLNLTKQYPFSEIAFNMNANFTGNKLDNLDGIINIENGTYKNRNGTLNLKGLELKSLIGENENKLSFTSDFFDFEMVGIYHFVSLIDALEKSLNKYIPAFSVEEAELTKHNIFNYQISAKNLDKLTAIFTPTYNIETPFLIYGKLNSKESFLSVEGSIPGLTTKNIHINNIYIGNKPKSDRYSLKFRFGEITLINGLSLYNLTIDSNVGQNIMDNQITWTNYHSTTYSGTIKTRSTFTRIDSTKHPIVFIEGFPSSVFIADSAWQITSFKAKIDSSAIDVRNFRFFNKEQEIAINGKISENEQDSLSIDFKAIGLDDLEAYLGKDPKLKGKLNGSAGIYDYYNERIFFSDLNISDFEYKDQKVGNISLSNVWDKNNAVLNSSVQIKKDNRQSLFATGMYDPATKQMDYTANVSNLSLVVLESVLYKNFSEFQGEASGKMRIYGKADSILMQGAIKGNNAGLTINYTQVDYQFSDSIYFKGDTIHFDKITIRDDKNNTGVFDGTIVHKNFRNMQYDLSLNSRKITAINTSPRDNEQFFGQVIGSGNLLITGFGTKINLSGSAATLAGTNVNISLDYKGEIEQYDFIEFVATNVSEKPDFVFSKKKEDDFTLDLTIRATPEAKAQLIYNSQIGDVIKAQGDGILLFAMDKEGNITLSGNYTVEKGDYLFTLQNVINKRFTIEQGGSLIWTGDPYNATIDLKAVYKLKASLYDLLVNSYDNVFQSQRIPVQCKILLTDELSNPAINFEIDFPTVEDRIVDEVQHFFNTEEEMNKQILSLVVMGKFYTPEYMRGTYESQNTNLLGTTTSELFSNQLSNWLSQINKNVDVGINYRPGNQIANGETYTSTKNEIELALSTQLFNDRVTINGNIGNNVNPHSTNNSQLVGDFDINVKLNPSGKIQFKAYNRSNNNLIYETAPYTQGIGLSFKEEYNTFTELLKKFGNIFKKK